MSFSSRWLRLLLILATAVSAQPVATPVREVATIRALAREVAAQALPVEVRGVVTFAYSRPTDGFVVNDETGGIYVESPPGSAVAPPAVGTLVALRGVTGPGHYAPVILAREIRPLGSAPLPPAQPATVGAMLSGRLDCQRVEVRGVVQRTEAIRGLNRLRLEVATEGGYVPVYFQKATGFEPERLLDAEVCIRGVCLPFFNERAELSGFRIAAHGMESLHVEKPAPEDPFAAPTVTLDRLQPFSPEGRPVHRRRTAGTVIYLERDDFLYLQDGERAVRVNASSTTDVTVGDRVEAAGFLQVREHFVELQRARLRKLGTAPLPAPLPIRRAQIVAPRALGSTYPAGDFSGRLVSLGGRLEKIERSESGGANLFLQESGHVIPALVNDRAAAERLADLQPGSELRVTGVCVVEYSHGWPARDWPLRTGFHLLLRGAEDVAVLRPAPWWTPQRLALALLAAGALLLLALGWAALLRKQVAERSAQLAGEMRSRREGEVEFAATLRERERIAADLHDTLEQALAGVTFQLEAGESFRAAAPERRDQHLRLAHQLLIRSREDVRRSVWNLRAQALEGHTLPEALRNVAESAGAGRAVAIEVTEGGTPRPLPEFAASNLLLLAQEAVTNAMKHGAPTRIRLDLGFAPGRVTLAIEDDGGGFDPATAPGAREGHFGLQGMTERVRRLGGEFLLESAPGRGTRITVTVPATEA